MSIVETRENRIYKIKEIGRLTDCNPNPRDKKSGDLPVANPKILKEKEITFSCNFSDLVTW